MNVPHVSHKLQKEIIFQDFFNIIQFYFRKENCTGLRGMRDRIRIP